jgi:hypothetical protein
MSQEVMLILQHSTSMHCFFALFLSVRVHAVSFAVIENGRDGFRININGRSEHFEKGIVVDVEFWQSIGATLGRRFWNGNDVALCIGCFYELQRHTLILVRVKFLRRNETKGIYHSRFARLALIIIEHDPNHAVSRGIFQEQFKKFARLFRELHCCFPRNKRAATFLWIGNFQRIGVLGIKGGRRQGGGKCGREERASQNAKLPQ